MFDSYTKMKTISESRGARLSLLSDPCIKVVRLTADAPAGQIAEFYYDAVQEQQRISPFPKEK